MRKKKHKFAQKKIVRNKEEKQKTEKAAELGRIQV